MQNIKTTKWCVGLQCSIAWMPSSLQRIAENRCWEKRKGGDITLKNYERGNSSQGIVYCYHHSAKLSWLLSLYIGPLLNFSSLCLSWVGLFWVVLFFSRLSPECFCYETFLFAVHLKSETPQSFLCVCIVECLFQSNIRACLTLNRRLWFIT